MTLPDVPMPVDNGHLRPTSEPSGGVSGALGVPTDEAFPVEAPSTADPEANGTEAMEQGEISNDVEMDFVGHVQNSQGIGSLEPSVDDCIAELLLAEMGSSGKSRKRDGRKGFRKLVSEIYSPPRVTDLLRKMNAGHLMAGFALDLTVIDEDGEPWDFTVESKRQRARQLVREQKPYFLIGSPACKDFSTWQALNMAKAKDPEAMKRARIASIMHLDFVTSLYQE